MGRRLVTVGAMTCAIGMAGLPSSALAEDGSDAAEPSASAPVLEVGACSTIRSTSSGRYLTRTNNGIGVGETGAGEPFRVQATGLGRYRLLDRRGDALSAGSLGGLVSSSSAADTGDWAVESAGPKSFALAQPGTGRQLALAPGGDRVSMTDAADDPELTRFSAEPARRCVDMPEIGTSSTGRSPRGEAPFGEVSGFLDTHVHGLAFEFLGGRVHCGRPWDPAGVTVALVDCVDHQGMGAGAVLENVLTTGTPVGTHDPVGWPTFKDWPRHDSLTHEQTYYKWIERTWRGGLRVMVDLLVENEALCKVYPLKQNRCDDMSSVRLQARRAYELQDYIDAQYGGPGKGWFRIVRSPFEARKVINDGKLAVILGIEVSSVFGCDIRDGVSACDRDDIDAGLAEVRKMGVRDLELVNKFDNALGGVAFDRGPTGVAINAANREETGRFWDAETCTGPAHDNDLTPGLPDGRDRLLGAGLLLNAPPPGLLPVYPAAPHCNTIGLSEIGKYLIRRMIEKGMIVDPDHLSARARSEALSVTEAADYSGVVSSHSWGDPVSDKRILHAGGVIGPYAGSSTGYASEWERIRKLRSKRYEFGLGFGPDMNGFGAQGGPRNGPNPVRYPFKSYDGEVTFRRQKSGERVFDINEDGVAHYGMYPDWIEDLRRLEGRPIVDDMARGPEAYLQMWERAVGVPRQSCLGKRDDLGNGAGEIAPGARVRELLRSEGQPQARDGRGWRWCVKGSKNDRVRASMSKRGRVQLVLSNARGHKAGGVHPSDRASRAKGRAVGDSIVIDPRNRVFVLDGGRVSHVGVADARVARRPELLLGSVERALD